MTSNLAGVLNLLLAQPCLTAEMQQRILAHGIRHRDFTLLARLAAHPALLTDIDHALAKVNSAVVKTAWLTRPGRTSEQIAEMVDTEKRVTVLAALMQTPGLPEQLYRDVVERCANRTVLVTTMRHQAIPEEIRRAAALKIIEQALPQSPAQDQLDDGCMRTIRDVLDTLPALADRLTGSEDLHVLNALARVVQLDHDVQLRVVTLHIARFRHAYTRASRSSYHHPAVQELIDLADGLAEYGSVTPEVISLLDHALAEAAGANTQSWIQSRIADCRIRITRSRPDATAAVRARVAAIDSPESLRDFVTETDAANNGHKLEFPHSVLRWCALEVIRSPYATEDDLVTVCGWFLWHDDTNDIIAAAGTTDSRRIATVISSLNHSDIDDNLDRVEHPAEVMTHLVTRAVNSTGHSRHGLYHLVDSRHFGPEHVRLIPLGMLMDQRLPDKLRDSLLEDLNAVITDEEAWNSFITLAEEFEGPVSDLISVCRAL